VAIVYKYFRPKRLSPLLRTGMPWLGKHPDFSGPIGLQQMAADVIIEK
jgi:hypothetical protein